MLGTKIVYGNLKGRCVLCRASCEPAKFEHDSLTQCYDVYVKKQAPAPPPPPPSPAGGENVLFCAVA